VSLVFLLFSFLALADKGSGASIGLAIENDSRNLLGPGSDQAYSSGFKLSYIYSENHIPKWAQVYAKEIDFHQDHLEQSKVNYGMSLGHQIFTPTNTETSDLVKEDRPYAAWLYLGFATRLKTTSRSHFLELDIGVIGPYANGESVQNQFHKITGNQAVRGWQNQLHNEIAIQLAYQQRTKFFELKNSKGSYFDVIPYFGASLGSVFVGGHLGGIVRFGVHLPDDYGPSRPSADDGDSFVSADAVENKNIALYSFVGARGNAVFRNIFLDGNTDRHSHSVTKYPFTTDTEFGFGTQFDRWAIVWRFVTRSPEFKEKSVFVSFASMNVNYFF
jgi:hypothetical protein